MKMGDGYASLPEQSDARKEYQFPSITTRMDQRAPASSSNRQKSPGPLTTIGNAVSTSVNSAKRIGHRARSLVPRKLLSAQYTPVKIKRDGTGAILDEVTPVIYYADDDPNAKRVDRGAVTFIDPFSFEVARSPCDKRDAISLSSPSSIVPVRLFHKDYGTTNADFAMEARKQENVVETDALVVFHSPIFAKAINRIDVKSIREETKPDSIRAKAIAHDESIEQIKDSDLSWGDFTISESFTAYKWDSESEDAVLESWEFSSHPSTPQAS
jgi:hypothetical protein